MEENKFLGIQAGMHLKQASVLTTKTRKHNPKSLRGVFIFVLMSGNNDTILFYWQKH